MKKNKLFIIASIVFVTILTFNMSFSQIDASNKNISLLSMISTAHAEEETTYTCTNECGEEIKVEEETSTTPYGDGSYQTTTVSTYTDSNGDVQQEVQSTYYSSSGEVVATYYDSTDGWCY